MKYEMHFCGGQNDCVRPRKEVLKDLRDAKRAFKKSGMRVSWGRKAKGRAALSSKAGEG